MTVELGGPAADRAWAPVIGFAVAVLVISGACLAIPHTSDDFTKTAEHSASH